MPSTSMSEASRSNVSWIPRCGFSWMSGSELRKRRMMNVPQRSHSMMQYCICLLLPVREGVGAPACGCRCVSRWSYGSACARGGSGYRVPVPGRRLLSCTPCKSAASRLRAWSVVGPPVQSSKRSPLFWESQMRLFAVAPAGTARACPCRPARFGEGTGELHSSQHLRHLTFSFALKSTPILLLFSLPKKWKCPAQRDKG